MNREAQKSGTVFLYPFPENLVCREVLVPSRNQEMQNMANPKVRREKYAVWKLFEDAVYQVFQKPADAFSFSKTPSGKWMTAEFSFSLTHTAGFSACVISEEPSGIDAEHLSTFRNYGPEKLRRLSEHAMTLKEYEGFLKCPEAEKPEYFGICWTGKESIYKMKDGPLFQPKAIDSSWSLCFRYLKEPEILISVSGCSKDSLQVYVSDGTELHLIPREQLEWVKI